MSEGAEASRECSKALTVAASASLSWMLNVAAPRWDRAESGSPFFPERMSISGQPDRACVHRTFVQARHVYAFCLAGQYGYDGPWRAMTAEVIDFLIRQGRRSDGFFVHSFAADGGVFDRRADFYDQAFMIFSLAHAGRALARDDLVEASEALADVLVSRWRHEKGGFLEGEIAKPPRRQNPHMHLFEAALAIYDVSGHVRWRALAEELAALCRRRFLDRSSGALMEYFEDDMSPVTQAASQRVEPGHCFEWCWLLESFGGEAAVESDRLASFARRHGVDASRGVAINEVSLTGEAIDTRARLWPQTERLKAALARYRRTGLLSEGQEALQALSGLQKYLDPAAPGTWRDKMLPSGGFVDEPAPGSSIYHIFCAFAELVETARC